MKKSSIRGNFTGRENARKRAAKKRRKQREAKRRKLLRQQKNAAADKEKSCKAVKKHRLVFNPSYWEVDFSDCIDNTDRICVCMVFRTACECCRRFHEAGS